MKRILAVIGLLVLAGCVGFLGGGSSSSPTTEGTTSPPDRSMTTTSSTTSFPTSTTQGVPVEIETTAELDSVETDVQFEELRTVVEVTVTGTFENVTLGLFVEESDAIGSSTLLSRDDLANGTATRTLTLSRNEPPQQGESYTLNITANDEVLEQRSITIDTAPSQSITCQNGVPPSDVDLERFLRSVGGEWTWSPGVVSAPESSNAEASASASFTRDGTRYDIAAYRYPDTTTAAESIEDDRGIAQTSLVAQDGTVAFYVYTTGQETVSDEAVTSLYTSFSCISEDDVRDIPPFGG